MFFIEIASLRVLCLFFYVYDASGGFMQNFFALPAKKDCNICPIMVY